jgi:nucleotidyltransferase/DNA polymerase involved in DNA repair
MAQTGALIEPMSIDEAYLDLSTLCQAQDADASLRQALPIAEQLKQRILTKRRVLCQEL